MVDRLLALDEVDSVPLFHLRDKMAGMLRLVLAGIIRRVMGGNDES
jgi:hypothetical protein